VVRIAKVMGREMVVGRKMALAVEVVTKITKIHTKFCKIIKIKMKI
jgi:hypothetical protein